MKVTALFFIDDGISDTDLTFNEAFLTYELSEKLKALPPVNEIYITVPESYSGELSGENNVIVRKDNDDVEFWKDLFIKTGADHIIRIFADSPFLDTDILSEMLELHTEYLAEFTYSENLPQGLGCEIVSRELIDSIPEFEEKTLPLAKVIKTNINYFDIELYYRDPDIRDKRITFRSGNPREKRIMENIFSLSNSIPKYPEIRKLIEEHPEVLYISPSYVEIELCGSCDLDCIFCYRNRLSEYHGTMEIPTLKNIIEGMKEFKIPYTVCFGGSGEPMMHPSFYEALDLCVHEDLIATIIVETNGLYADTNYRNYLEKRGNEKIKTIVNINGYDPTTYTTIHGSDHFQRVHDNIAQLESFNESGESVYIQIMKINETEPFLDSYYDFWEKRNVPIILQKQNTYIGLLEDRRYSDLSPIDRTPCWHLQRDLYILNDGRVTFCKQDPDGNITAGNVSENSLLDIWGIKKKAFLNDYNNNYPSKPDCVACDEWYTFNN